MFLKWLSTFRICQRGITSVFWRTVWACCFGLELFSTVKMQRRHITHISKHTHDICTQSSPGLIIILQDCRALSKNLILPLVTCPYTFLSSQNSQVGTTMPPSQVFLFLFMSWFISGHIPICALSVLATSKPTQDVFSEKDWFSLRQELNEKMCMACTTKMWLDT